jgi:CRP-like cAMP-binding protein
VGEQAGTGRTRSNAARRPAERRLVQVWSAILDPGGRAGAARDIRELAKNKLLFASGERPRELYVLLDGTVARVGIDSSGRETTIRLHEAGDAIGLAEMLAGGTYMTGARAIVAARVLCVPAAALRRTLAPLADTSSMVIAQLVSECRSELEQLADLTLRSAPQRLGRYLLRLSRAAANRDVSLPHDKHVIAASLGMSAETLSRCVATLREHGVDAHGSIIHITDEQRLNNFAEPQVLHR